MRSLGRLGLALSAAGLAAVAPATVDSHAAPATPQVKLDTPVEPDARLAPSGAGGWTSEGWLDTAAGPDHAGADAGRSAMPRQPDWREDRPLAGEGPPPDRDMRWNGGPHDGWRRQTWDGGRGDAYRYRPGGRLPRIFASPRYVVPDWRGYGLFPPGPGQRWVRFYDDAVLVDSYGFVVDAVPAIGWDRPNFAYDERGFRSGERDGRWRDDGVTWGEGGSSGADGGPVVHYGPGGTTIVTTRSPAVTTTTTTVTESYVYSSPKRVWRAKPKRTWHAKPRCACR